MSLTVRLFLENFPLIYSEKFPKMFTILTRKEFHKAAIKFLAHIKYEDTFISFLTLLTSEHGTTADDDEKTINELHVQLAIDHNPDNSI